MLIACIASACGAALYAVYTCCPKRDLFRAHATIAMLDSLFVGCSSLALCAYDKNLPLSYVVGSSAAVDAVTSWYCGYMLYDVVIRVSCWRGRWRSLCDPSYLTHHALALFIYYTSMRARVFGLPRALSFSLLLGDSITSARRVSTHARTRVVLYYCELLWFVGRVPWAAYIFSKSVAHFHDPAVPAYASTLLTCAYANFLVLLIYWAVVKMQRMKVVLKK